MAAAARRACAFGGAFTFGGAFDFGGRVRWGCAPGAAAVRPPVGGHGSGGSAPDGSPPTAPGSILLRATCPASAGEARAVRAGSAWDMREP
jgi:hypothetical protein